MSLAESKKIIRQGWLWKCPRLNKLFSTKWSRRWVCLEVRCIEGRNEFVVLKQFSTKDLDCCRRILGLNLCDELRTGNDLKHRRKSYPHTFGIKLLNEWYYFAADTENDLNEWVDSINSACGLKKTASKTSVNLSTNKWLYKLRNALFSSSSSLPIDKNKLSKGQDPGPSGIVDKPSNVSINEGSTLNSIQAMSSGESAESTSPVSLVSNSNVSLNTAVNALKNINPATQKVTQKVS